MEINFSYNYKKLAGQTSATLIGVEDFILNKENREKYREFLMKDTEKEDGTFYELRNGNYIIMFFRGNKGIEFTTIRYAKPFYYGKCFDRKAWALDRIGKEFKIIIKNGSNKMKTNMEYCKYQNTLKALKELNEILEWDTEAMFNLSDEEYRAMIKIIKIAMTIGVCPHVAKENYDYNNIKLD